MRFLNTIESILFGLVVSLFTAFTLIPIVTAQRGYMAVGGEWFLIIGVGIYSAYIFRI